MNEPESTEPATALAIARTFIAHQVLSSIVDDPALGDVTLRPHQLRAVARARQLLARHHGALLADEAGMGKTYVALAIARHYSSTIVVAPASLRATWEAAMRRCRFRARIESLERLSRVPASDIVASAPLVIVDEAHHLRNVATKRYGAVAALCDRARVLLVSATPVQNDRVDLAAELALFLGDTAWSMPDAELARFVVRRAPERLGPTLPAIDGPRWIRIPPDDDLLDAIMALPPPLPPSGEGDGGMLVVYTLLRQWASSRAALTEALRRRIARATAMISSLEAGQWPDRQALSAWTYADSAVQLALPELLASSPATAVEALLDRVRDHHRGLAQLLARIRTRADPDEHRAAAMRDLRARHAGARIIAFSQFAETVRALARLLLPDGGVAELTARGVRIAGGRMTRAEVLTQLAPSGCNVHPSRRIDMLVSTDALSEGLDMQAASVVVHLDLPWNPARLEQRLGRVRRIGSAFSVIHAYAFAPPAAAERVLRVEARLRQKLTAARYVVGSPLSILPGAPVGPPEAALAEAAGESFRLLERWLDPLESTARTGNLPLLAASRAHTKGFVALLADAGELLLVADIGAGPTIDARIVTEALKALEGEALQPRARDVDDALEVLRSWWSLRRGHRVLGLLTPDGARIRRHLSMRVAQLLARTARQDRVRLAAIASRARRTMAAPLGAASERALGDLAHASATDERWLGAIATLGEGRDASDGSGPMPLGANNPDSLSGVTAPALAVVLLYGSPLGQRGRAQAQDHEAGTGTST